MSKKRNLNLRNIKVRELKEALLKLQVITVGNDAKNNEVIEGNEWEVNYRITKERASQFPSFVVYMLRVSGPEENRLNLTSKFIELLGNPSKKFPLGIQPDIEYLCWEAKEIDQPG